MSIVINELLKLRNNDKSKILTRFFKTGKGEYGEGDVFLGITVPVSRSIAKKYSHMDFKEIQELLNNKYHEVRLVALLILVHKYKKLTSPMSEIGEKKKIVEFYLRNTKYINNWDLVDLSAHYILGDYLFDKDKKILIKLAESKNLWERRIAIISTFAFIYKGEANWTLKIVDILMKDKHDLIHKACGWMLREIGKKVEEKQLLSYLEKNSKKMPRTMLRYSIERLPETKRLYYLSK